MAYSCVRVQFEIGHEAFIRAKHTPEGFTHDWEVFVRGAENTEIHHFIEKVVFHLHETFLKPKRVVKDPPYSVKESGYAGFTLPIEVYLKTREEPRKLYYNYDLNLSTNLNIVNVQKEKKIFNNPSEDFRRKLIKGGGIGVGSDMLHISGSDLVSSTTNNNSELNNINDVISTSTIDEKSMTSSSGKSKPNSKSDGAKKHKVKESYRPEENRGSDAFTDLFGSPIKTHKQSPITKPVAKISESKHSFSDKQVFSSSKSSKHSPHKDKDKDRDKEMSKKESLVTCMSKVIEKSRDKENMKEKSQDKPVKRPSSTSPAPPPPLVKVKEEKKSSHKENVSLKSSSDVKREKHKDKKSREDKDKKDRQKDKDHESSSKKESTSVETEKVIDKSEQIKIEPKEQVKEIEKKSPKNFIVNEEKKDKSEREVKERVKTDKNESDKQKHNHKKKEKKKDDRSEREKEKSSKKGKIVKKPQVIIEPSPPPPPPQLKTKLISPNQKSKHPLSTLLEELSEKGSDSGVSVTVDEKVRHKTFKEDKIEKKIEIVEEKSKKKEKKSSKDVESSKKRKRIKEKEEPDMPEKVVKLKLDTKGNFILEETERVEPMEVNIVETLPTLKKVYKEEGEISRSPTPLPKFTEEYVRELKDLQNKIMTLEDNMKLQRVVQVVAETGQYEITKKTFDFDLCTLDKSTISRLQDLFFVAS